MIIVEDVWKSYGRQVLFEGISFKINQRERIGVVGRNGHGKTTLFRLIAGLEEPDRGQIIRPKKYLIGYVEQEPHFKASTVFEEAARFMRPEESNETWRVEKVLAGLGFKTSDFYKPPSALSGGFQVRLNLAKVLLSPYDLLLLDEPNNYLDITSIRWLTRYLIEWPGELMLITHDRNFMDSVVTDVLGIHRRKVKKIKGNTEKYYQQIAQEEETYEKTRINDERKRKEIEVFINRFRAKARLANLVQSRIKTLAKMEKKEKLEKLATLDFSFRYEPYFGKYVLSLDEITFSYGGEKPLIENFSLTVGARDKIFIIGPNGRGKTTLIKLMAGLLKPQKGEVIIPQKVKVGVYEQSGLESLNEERTVLEEVMAADPEKEPQRARQICGSMMFEGEAALKKIAILSGGEKSRVLLAKILARPVNLLILDEPTNHLDLESCDALLTALDNFEGAVIMVTHNEMFLKALAERLVVFEKDKVAIYEMDYNRFLEKIGWEEEKEEKMPERTRVEKFETGQSRKEWRRLRSEIIAAKSATLKPLESRLASLERLIEKREVEIQKLKEAIIEASKQRKGQEIGEMTKKWRLWQRELDSWWEEMDQVLKEYESKKAEFDQKLKEIN
ncbi:MAG: ATP-binding cassette domain-containing protein [Candidatus Aminicenantes bacterium]|nr:ATP-binding cassette domain-containing protein [Candidatus Aminicenantes bacterium]